MMMAKVIFLQAISFSLIKFFLVGISNTFVGLSAIYLVTWSFGVSASIANAAGYLLGLMVSFVLNKRWTFHHGGPIVPAFIRFIAIFAIAYLANLGTVLILIEQFRVNEYLAQAAGIPPYTILFYLGSRYIAFR